MVSLALSMPPPDSMDWALLTLTAACIVAAVLAVRWWMRLSKLPYQELEKELIGYENLHLPPQQRMAKMDLIKPKLALLVAFLILVACVLAWKTADAFLT
jgi:hypothetical protein